MVERAGGLIRTLRGASAFRLAARGIALAGVSAFFCYALMVSCFDAGYSRLLGAFAFALSAGVYALRHWGAAPSLALGAGLSLVGIALMALGVLLRVAGAVELVGTVHVAIGVATGFSILSAVVDLGDLKAPSRSGGMISSTALYLSLCGPVLVFAAAQRVCFLLLFRVGAGPFDSMFESGERAALLLASLAMGLGFAIGGVRASRRRSDGIVGVGLATLWALIGISSALGIETVFAVLAVVACLLMPMVLAWLVRAGEVVDVDALRFLALASAALIVCWGGRFDSVILSGSGLSTTLFMSMLAAACVCGAGLYRMQVRKALRDGSASQHGAGAHRQEARERLLASLSARESAVAEMVVEGATQASIAAALGLSRGTVATYCRRIYEKAGCENRAAFLREYGSSERACVQNGHSREASLENETGNENGPVHGIAPDAMGRASSMLLVACDIAATLLVVVPGLAPYGSAAGMPPFSWMVSVSLALLGFVLVSSWQGADPATATSCAAKRRIRWLLGTRGAVLVALLGSMAFYRGASNTFAQEIGLVMTGAYALTSSMRLIGHLFGLARVGSSPCERCIVGAVSPLLALLLAKALASASAQWASLLVFCGHLLAVFAAGCVLRRQGLGVWPFENGGSIGFSLPPRPAALLAVGGLGLSYAMARVNPSPITVFSWLFLPLALVMVSLLICRPMRDSWLCARAFAAGAGWMSLGVLAGTLWGGALPSVMRITSLVFLVCGCALYVRELERRVAFANLDLPGKIRESCAEFGITAAEASTAALLAGGLTVDECARQRFVSRATIVSQRRSAYAKLGVRTRDELRACIDKRIARRLDA